MKRVLAVADIEEIKRRLKSYARQNIVYNQPHVDERCYDRYKLPLGEFEKQLLNPQNLVFAEVQESKNPNFDRVYALYFAVSKSTTYLIPVSFKPKVLYVITVIKMTKIVGIPITKVQGFLPTIFGMPETSRGLPA